MVFHGVTYGATVISPPRFAPSSLNCTPMTPTLSVAGALTETVADRDADAGARGAIAGRIARDRRERMVAVGRRGGVPRRRIRGRHHLGAEIRAIELELHADDRDVVGRRGGD